MGSTEGKKKGSHVASDSMSEYSVSFAGLVCIHDNQQQQQQQQQPKPHVPNRDKYIRVSKKTDLDFEFLTNNNAELNTTFAATSMKITHADVLFSNGQIKAQQEVAAFPTNSPTSLSTLQGIGDDHYSNMISNDHTQVTAKGRNHANKERSSVTTTTSFGKKVCKSFLAPCRECKVIQPSAVKVQKTSVSGEKSKLLT
ncbi:hypothetical protein Lal_00025724 [Lupinus albus]|uniref:Uncharacterized protein n=1 Tax=Lupinus albus TaxID=3870 RepID=A0A6A5LQX4_LUPAL|nr:hypothetical protein Lalb_Chr09g0327791 [Lupinus albus]KAF1861415.1 hypothetical protein Lal_00025724 [Lupinus albus]